MFVLVEAAVEVIVCAGAIDSPRLLLHSGLGPAPELAELGYELVGEAALTVVRGSTPEVV